VILQSGIDAFNLSIETKLHRASPGGTGGIKSITNYAPVSIVCNWFDFDTVYEVAVVNTIEVFH
jgi:hypothetical protein